MSVLSFLCISLEKYISANNNSVVTGIGSAERVTVSHRVKSFSRKSILSDLITKLFWSAFQNLI